MRIVDFRSDTITVPTPEMRKAMYEAEVGDDVYGEDLTVKKLEEYAAEKVGKEAALFVTSGTMGNQLALLCHCQRGQEIILEEDTHIYNAEVGGAAVLSGVQVKALKGKKGIMSVEDIEKAIRIKDIHMPKTGLICIENTHNMSGGFVTPLETMEKTYALAKKHALPVHVDGARIFNAATYLNCDVKSITQYCDSIMFCLSKGLCAPIGSILAGSKEFIENARRYRKMLGAGMRQVGVIAAPGLVALEHMVDRLAEDHENARKFADGLRSIRTLKVDGEIQTNILMLDVSNTNYSSDQVVAKLKERGILSGAIDDKTIRFVTHYYVTADDIEYALQIINDIFNEN